LIAGGKRSGLSTPIPATNHQESFFRQIFRTEARPGRRSEYGMSTQIEKMLDNVVAIQVGENTTGQEMAQITEALRRTIMEWGKIRLFVEIEDFRHMDSEALIEKLRFAISSAKDIERVAVISRRVWIKAWIQAGGLVLPTQLMHFDASEKEAAWRWIRE
jgi:hypothetical protein